jgi:N-acetyl-gamma-glutamyl-phosphate reductase
VRDTLQVNSSACCINHPETDLTFVNSESNAGNRITDVHEGLYGDTDLTFTE